VGGERSLFTRLTRQNDWRIRRERFRIGFVHVQVHADASAHREDPIEENEQRHVERHRAMS
jgi:hypothetical protein